MIEPLREWPFVGLGCQVTVFISDFTKRRVCKAGFPILTFHNYTEWHVILNQDALALIFFIDLLRVEIYRRLDCRVDGQQWNRDHASDRRDVQNHPFRSFYHVRQHWSCHLMSRKNINIYQFLDGTDQIKNAQKVFKILISHSLVIH